MVCSDTVVSSRTRRPRTPGEGGGVVQRRNHQTGGRCRWSGGEFGPVLAALSKPLERPCTWRHPRGPWHDPLGPWRGRLL